jgi:hypothetical protein
MTSLPHNNGLNIANEQRKYSKIDTSKLIKTNI